MLFISRITKIDQLSSLTICHGYNLKNIPGFVLPGLMLCLNHSSIRTGLEIYHIKKGPILANLLTQPQLKKVNSSDLGLKSTHLKNQASKK